MIRSLAKMMIPAAAVAGLAMAVSTIAGAAGTPSAQDYVTKAAIGDMFEIQSSQLAVQKSQDDDVRDFAQMMIDDHTKSTAMIKQAVSDSGANLTIPDSMDSTHKDMMANLRQTSNDDFDKTYLMIQSEAHQKAHALHKGYATNGEDDALREAAEDITPVIEKHIDHLHEMME